MMFGLFAAVAALERESNAAATIRFSFMSSAPQVWFVDPVANLTATEPGLRRIVRLARSGARRVRPEPVKHKCAFRREPPRCGRRFGRASGGVRRAADRNLAAVLRPGVARPRSVDGPARAGVE